MSKILVINSGSATLKFKIFSYPKMVEEVSGSVERVGIADSFLEYKINGSSKQKIDYPKGLKSHGEAFEEVIKALKGYIPEIKYTGHRIVHGGPVFADTVQATKKNIMELKKYESLAPLHNPVNVACLEKAMELIPQAKHFMVFDTGYYKTVPKYAKLYPLPQELAEDHGIERYGFHGISHKYAAREGARLAKVNLKKSKIITCHLGSGCSISATLNGQAVDTSMGFTPVSGIMMSTRAGDIDACIPLYLLKNLKMSVDEVDKLLNKQSGLLGVAGTMDMREILAGAGKKVVGYKVGKKFNTKEKGSCGLALKMFIYAIIKYIGQLMATMKGLDLLVFTGGVGERSPVIRDLIVKDLKWLGKLKVVVVPANEELMIAKEVVEKVK